MIADGSLTKLRLFAHNAQSRLSALTMPSQRVCTAYGAELQMQKEKGVSSFCLSCQQSCRKTY
jgi:hypothetical protein